MPLVAVVATLVVLVVAGAARASNSETYRDPLGDTVAAPDIGAVRVTNDDAGRLVFAIGVADRRRLELGDVYVLWLDVDLNERNGARGYEYALIVDGSARRVLLARYDGGRWSPAAARELAARWRDGLTVTLDRRAIGTPEQVDFGIASWAGGDVDWAPEGRPDWRFQLIVSPKL